MMPLVELYMFVSSPGMLGELLNTVDILLSGPAAAAIAVPAAVSLFSSIQANSQANKSRQAAKSSAANAQAGQQAQFDALFGLTKEQQEMALALLAQMQQPISGTGSKFIDGKVSLPAIQTALGAFPNASPNNSSLGSSNGLLGAFAQSDANNASIANQAFGTLFNEAIKELFSGNSGPVPNAPAIPIPQPDFIDAPSVDTSSLLPVDLG